MNVPRSRRTGNRLVRVLTITLGVLVLLTGPTGTALAAPTPEPSAPPTGTGPGTDWVAVLKDMLDRAQPSLDNLPPKLVAPLIFALGVVILAAIVWCLFMFFGGVATGATASRDTNPQKVAAARGRLAGGLLGIVVIIASAWGLVWLAGTFA